MYLCCSTDANELSRGAVIGIAAGVGGFAVSVLLLCLCAGIVSFLILRCRAKGPIEGVRRTIRDIGRNNIDHDSETLKIKLDDLTKDIDKIASLLRLGHDGEHDPDVDKSIESFKESVENALDIINRITNTNANIQNPANNSDTAGEETTV